MTRKRRSISILDPYSDEIRKLAAEGLSDARIAAALEIDADGQMVDRWRKKNGVPRAKTEYVSALDPYKDEIRRMYLDDGLTDSLIAQSLPIEVSENSVYSYRTKKLGIKSDRKRKAGRFNMEARFEEIKDELPEAWERSMQLHKTQKRMVGSAKRVGEQFGVSASTASRWLARLGLVETRIDGKIAAKKALDLFDEGLSVPSIAKEIGASEESVRNWLKAQGRDLSNYFQRMTHQEKMAWRRAISEAKAKSVAGSGQYSYDGVRLDSPQEVVFAEHCDRVGLSWQPYDRAGMGVCEVAFGEQIIRYAPDFVVGDIAVEIKGIYDETAATKVKAWRTAKGPLALIMKDQLFDFEDAQTARDAMVVLRGACYLDPEAEEAFWEDKSDQYGTSDGAIAAEE